MPCDLSYTLLLTKSRRVALVCQRKYASDVEADVAWSKLHHATLGGKVHIRQELLARSKARPKNVTTE